MHRLIVFVFAICSVTSCWGSGCPFTYLEGTYSGYGKVPLYSSSMLLSSSLLLTTEGSLSKDQRSTADIGLIASGLYFYIAAHGYCKTIERKKYDKLVAQRNAILEKDPGALLPRELGFLAPIPSEEEYSDQIKNWKSRQKKLLFIVGGLNSIFLHENAQAADTEGVKIFSYLSIVAIVGMSVFDVDKLWDEGNPSWVDVSFLAERIGEDVVPGMYFSFRY